MSAMLVFYKLFVSCFLLFSVISYGNCSSRKRQICPQNEIYVKCIKKCNTCKERGNCGGIPKCEPGCDCKPGFLRNNVGKCIPINQCEPPFPLCRSDEEYRVCSCDQNCCNQGNEEACGKECLTGCFCRKGLFRDDLGNCVRIEDCPLSLVSGTECPLINCISGCYLDDSKPCPKCACPPEEVCGPNSTPSDCVPCTPSCNNSNPVCPAVCRSGCACNPGFIYDDYGNCILPSQCPGGAFCPPNSIPTECVPCTPSCKNPNPVCTADCRRGCACLPGLIYDDFGNCIWPNQCPKGSQICGPNSKPTDCVPCTPTCNNSNPVCTADCKPGCACNPGYIKDNFGNCILPNQCPGVIPIICPPNSKPTDCVPCTPSCKNSNPVCPAVCKPGCACNPGYIYDDFGNCILPKQCIGGTNAIICPPNSKPTDCVPCTPSCKNSNPVCAAVCKPGCACNPGYIYDDFGNCIWPNQCPRNTTICGPNSKPSDCASLCPPTCDIRYPNCGIDCVKGCKCDPGFVIGDDGTCVPPLQCPRVPIICVPNSRPTNCVSCKPTCSIKNPGCAAVCVNGCECFPGYIKDDYGNCVLPEECPKACGPNSKMSNCGSLCPPTCDNPNPVCATVCVTDVCVCNPGFLLDRNGKCIPADQCPGASSCGPNEFFSDCVNPCNNCDDKGNCQFLVCNKGCDCLPGYYRNNNSRCIPEIQCPKPANCPPNSIYSTCASPCPPTCRIRNPYCADVCVNGCVCIPDYIKDDVTGLCIPEYLCPRSP